VEKPYIKKYKRTIGADVYFVDGEFVRSNIDKEFTNFGQHYRFPFIPQNEFWIDGEKKTGETDFFVGHMIIERRMMKQGKSYAEAIDIANKIEKRERARSVFSKEIKRLPKDERMEKVKKEKLIDAGKISVWLVKGELVRDLFYIDFTEGGHDKVYSFVPENEVWIDDDLSFGERKYVLVHELNERWLMFRGEDYDSAHLSSSSLEFFCRKIEFMTLPILLFLKFANRFLI